MANGTFFSLFRRINLKPNIKRPKKEDKKRIKESVESVARRGVPEWLDFDSEKLSGIVKRLPNRDDFTLPLDEQLIIEFYSKL